MSANKTIAKNTLFLYFRMLLVMGVSLYTSRIVLRELGVSDYGVYSLVGGFVALFGFLNSAMSTATQRYLTFDLGTGDTERLQKTFSVTLTIHLGIAGLVFLLAETIGLWYVNYVMVFPPERTYAVNVVYQFSIGAALLSIIQVPYNALIIAREQMKIYAYVSIVEVLLKLGIVFLLVFMGSDKLITYAILVFVVALVISLFYQWYCRKNYKESHYRWQWDKTYYKELVSYSGWNLFGQSANLLSTQGTGVLFNLFYGVTINAAISIANQVNTAVYGFVSNFQLAFNPQITKTYAKTQLAEHKKLLFTSSKLSLIIMSVLAGPILLFTGRILEIWLGSNLPDYVIQFVQIVLLYSLVDALSGPFWTSAYAIGHVKKYNLGISCINFLTLPIIYFLLKLGVEPYLAFLTKLGISITIQIFRYYHVNTYLKFKVSEFFPYLWRVLLLFSFNAGVCELSYQYNLEDSWGIFFIGVGFLELVLFIFIVVLILNKQEKKTIKNMINRKIRHNA